MAYVKVKLIKHSEELINYSYRKLEPGDPVDTEGCPPLASGTLAEFRAVRAQHNFKEGNNEVFHIVQSWDENESKKITPQTVNSIGRKLVEDYFKGHQFCVITHTDTGKLHNHIIVNSIHMETGKAIEHKFKHLHELRKISDKLCLERGLHVINKEANERKERIPQKVQNMARNGRESWLLDLRTKADFARYLSVSFDQYKDYLDAFGIEARIEDKNISYFYPGRTKAKRGSKLGKAYDKEGLSKQFRENDERFKKHPEIRAQLLSAQEQLSKNPRQTLQTTDDILTRAGVQTDQAVKDYAKFTKNKRRAPDERPLSEKELSSEIISSNEVRKARRSIIEYCKENNIALSTNKFGQTTLKDRSYVVINDDIATNNKNGTRGSLIDFVAAHHGISLLQAVGKINGSQSPELFAKHYGDIKRKFTSFYIPKPDQMPHAQATEHLGKFLKSVGSHPHLADDLLKFQRAEVSKKGVIRLFADSDSSGTYEFHQGSDNKWSQKKQGEFRAPFFSRSARRNIISLFLDPLTFVKSRSSLSTGASQGNGMLVLMEPNKEVVDQYLNQNPGVKRIQVVTPKHKSLSQSELDFFGVLKQKLHDRGIEVTSVSQEKALSHEGLSL